MSNATMIDPRRRSFAEQPRKRGRPAKSTSAMRLEDLRTIVDACFARLDQDMKEVANDTGLCVSTLYRLNSDKLTLHVEFGTIQRLCLAAGVSLTIDEDQAIHVRLVD